MTAEDHGREARPCHPFAVVIMSILEDPSTRKKAGEKTLKLP
jgi:hypothetical protein